MSFMSEQRFPKYIQIQKFMKYVGKKLQIKKSWNTKISQQKYLISVYVLISATDKKN